MDDRLPWPRRQALAALIFVGAAWLLGALLLVALPGPAVGATVLAIALWLTFGLVYSALRAPAGREGEGGAA